MCYFKLLNVKSNREKILMTGDGGDESFTGYDRYRSIHILNFLRKFNFFNIKLKNTKNKNLKDYF